MKSILLPAKMAKRQSGWARLKRRLPVGSRTLAVAGAVVLGVWIVLALLAPWIAPADPLAQTSGSYLPPSAEHLFGTDRQGRDVLSRVLYGGRISMPLAGLLVVLAMTIGTTLGALAGYFGGAVDAVIMRCTDLFFAFPPIILAMAVTAALGPGLRNAVFAIAIVAWPTYARVSRGLVMSARSADYVLAGRLLGSPFHRSLLVDIRPNMIAAILVLAALDFGNAVLLLSGLSFLGLGAQPPSAEWGAMVASGAQSFDKWWVSAFPGIAILTVVMAFNFVGDALRDYLDPRLARQIGG